MARESWSNKLIYISTVAGATIGFGATWRFPYLVGENGGGAYLLVFFIAMLVLGVPMLVAEHLIGRRLHTNVVDLQTLERSRYYCHTRCLWNSRLLHGSWWLGNELYRRHLPRRN